MVVHSQFGMTPDERRFFERLGTRRQKPFRLISRDVCCHGRDFILGLLAFAKLQESHPDSESWIIIDGIEIGHLKGLTRKLGVEERLPCGKTANTSRCLWQVGRVRCTGASRGA